MHDHLMQQRAALAIYDAGQMESRVNSATD